MLKIRLRRMGSRHRPFYRVVVSDSRRTPTSSALDEIGFYDPRKQPSLIELDLDRVDHWVSRGAQPSDTVSKLVKKARRAAAAEPQAEAAEEATEASAEAEVAEAEVAEAAAEEVATEASDEGAESAEAEEATKAAEDGEGEEA